MKTSSIFDKAAKINGEGKQFALPHVFMFPDQLNKFVDEFKYVFDGTADPISNLNLAAVPAEMSFTDLYTSVGAISAQAYKDNKAPYPMGRENVGIAVKDMDTALIAAQKVGVKILARWEVMGNQEAMTEWPGAIRIQFYSFATGAPAREIRESVSDTRYYLSLEDADKFIGAFLKVTDGIITQNRYIKSEDIGLEGQAFRRISLTSESGNFNIIILTEKEKGQLAYPYNSIITDFEVTDVNTIVDRARARGVDVLVRAGLDSTGNLRAVLRFTGEYVIEIHQKRK